MSENELKIDIRDVYRLLGGAGEPSGQSVAELESAAAAVIIAAQPRVVSRRCKIFRTGSAISLENTALELPGKSIEALLTDCDECVIFCATIGAQVEQLIKKAQIRDVALASILDACASVAAESLAQCANAEISSGITAEGKYTTDRFSPGYGDLPIGVQSAFCASLDTERRIGVTVGADSMMRPVKSVTAVIGIAPTPQKSRDTGCRDCAKLSDCKFRERGVTCYGEAL